MKTLILSVLLLATPISISAENDHKSPSSSPTKRRLITRATLEKAESVDPVFNVLILGPESVPAGTLVKLDASQTQADTFAWRLSGFDSKVYDVANDGKVVYFANPVPGRYPFTLAVAKRNGDGKPLLMTAEHVVIVQPPTPDPDKPNVVTPVVDPVKPDPLDKGKYGLAKMTRDIIVAALAKDPKMNKKLCNDFSVNFNLVASQLRSGATVGITAAITDVQGKNQVSANGDIAQWKAPVMTPLSAELQRLSKAYTMKDTDWADAFGEIATGFAAGGQ